MKSNENVIFIHVNKTCSLKTYAYNWASPVAQSVMNPSAMPETWVRSLGWEDPLEKEMATHSVFLPGESRGRKSLVGYSPWGHRESDTTEKLHFTSLVAQSVRNLSAMQEAWVDPWVGKIPWRRKWQLAPVFLHGEVHGQRRLVGYIVHGVAKSQT